MQVNVLKLTVEDLEKERDFYFGKLRNIELICQENEGENNPVLQRIVDILYATDVRVDYEDIFLPFCHLRKFYLVGFGKLSANASRVPV